MALRPCKECKKEISSDAKVCPHCGKRTGGARIGIWLLAIICILVILSAIGHLMDESQTGNSAGGAVAGVEHQPTQPTWEYTSRVDSMGRGTTEFASLESVNQVNFDFPYNGGSQGILTLRNSPKYGKDVLLEVSKGQFLCDFEDCHVNIRINDGRPLRVEGNEAADGSSNVIFFPYSTLYRDLVRARVLRIEANFYQEGSRVFEFHPQGLKTKMLPPTK